MPQEKKNIFKIFQLSLEAKGAPRLNFSAAVPAFDIPDICLLFILILLCKEE